MVLEFVGISQTLTLLIFIHSRTFDFQACLLTRLVQILMALTSLIL
jgi:hypothetical protein